MNTIKIGPVTNVLLIDFLKADINLLRDAYAIIDGIPANRIDLGSFQRPNDDAAFAYDTDQIGCGMLACAGGWLALHPDMRARGLLADMTGTPKNYNSSGDVCYGYSALSILFKLPYHVCMWLFASREAQYPESEKENINDKDLWLRRCKTVIDAYETARSQGGFVLA